MTNTTREITPFQHQQKWNLHKHIVCLSHQLSNGKTHTKMHQPSTFFHLIRTAKMHFRWFWWMLLYHCRLPNKYTLSHVLMCILHVQSVEKVCSPGVYAYMPEVREMCMMVQCYNWGENVRSRRSSANASTPTENCNSPCVRRCTILCNIRADV